jgi:2-oxo-3-hexenedioate decarboxylase
MTPEQLLQHADSGELWPRPTGQTGFASLDGAYQAALAVRALRLARGEAPRGYKVGFTNRTIWRRYGVFAPIWGGVWDTTLSRCDGAGELSVASLRDVLGIGAMGARSLRFTGLAGNVTALRYLASGELELSLDALCQPRIEPEAVFGLRAAPAAGAGLDALFDALDWVAPGFEIVQSHLPQWKFNAAETVADGALHGRLLVGRPVPVRALAADATALSERLAAARVELRCDGAAVESGAGSNVLDGPVQALLHFINELRACPGAPALAAGDVITTGTWTDAWPVQRGQAWSSSYSDALDGLLVRFV